MAQRGAEVALDSTLCGGAFVCAYVCVRLPVSVRVCTYKNVRVCAHDCVCD